MAVTINLNSMKWFKFGAYMKLNDLYLNCVNMKRNCIIQNNI